MGVFFSQKFQNFHIGSLIRTITKDFGGKHVQQILYPPPKHSSTRGCSVIGVIWLHNLCLQSRDEGHFPNKVGEVRIPGFSFLFSPTVHIWNWDHWRLKYTEVQSQQMAFTQSPSLSNNPKIPTYYLIFADIWHFMIFHDIWHFMIFHDIWHFTKFKNSWHLTFQHIWHFMLFVIWHLK